MEGMGTKICPFCGKTSRIYDSRVTKEGFIRRNRECVGCGSRWVTMEKCIKILDHVTCGSRFGSR